MSEVKSSNHNLSFKNPNELNKLNKLNELNKLTELKDCILLINTKYFF